MPGKTMDRGLDEDSLPASEVSYYSCQAQSQRMTIVRLPVNSYAAKSHSQPTTSPAIVLVWYSPRPRLLYKAPIELAQGLARQPVEV